jgi:spermidine synthase
MREAFGDRVLELAPSAAGNVVVLGAIGAAIHATLPDLRAQALQLKARTGLDLRPTVSRLAARGARIDL